MEHPTTPAIPPASTTSSLDMPVTDDEVRILRRLSRDTTLPVFVCRRAQALLWVALGISRARICAEVQVRDVTLRRWGRKWREMRVQWFVRQLEQVGEAVPVELVLWGRSRE